MDITILVQKFCDYSLYFKGYSPYTIKGYKDALRYYRQFADITNLDQVTKDNVRSMFYNGRLERKWSANTFIGFHKRLNVFFRWCQQNQYMDFNPMNDIEVPKLEKRIPPKLTKENSLKLLEVVFNYPYNFSYLRYRNHALFATILFAGLRKKEVKNLMLMDVDIEHLTIFIRQAKGAKDRIIPMSYTLAQSLSRYLKERKRLNKSCPNFFVSLNRNMGITDDCLRNLVRKMKDASNIQFSLHKLRHTFATLMLEGGCDIYSLSKMMGHSDIKTTTIYLHASAEHLRHEMQKHPLNN